MNKTAAEIAGAMIAATPKQEKPTKYIEFPIPENFQPPADLKPDTDFQALGTFQIKSNGKMCLIAVDGSPVTQES